MTRCLRLRESPHASMLHGLIRLVKLRSGQDRWYPPSNDQAPGVRTNRHSDHVSMAVAGPSLEPLNKFNIEARFHPVSSLPANRSPFCHSSSCRFLVSRQVFTIVCQYFSWSYGNYRYSAVIFSKSTGAADCPVTDTLDSGVRLREEGECQTTHL